MSSPAFQCLQQFVSCSLELDPYKHPWVVIRHAQWVQLKLDVITSPTCMSIFSPSGFSWGYIELCLCQVPNPPYISSTVWHLQILYQILFMLALCASLWPLRSLSQHTTAWPVHNAEFMLATGFKDFYHRKKHGAICRYPPHADK